MTPKTHWEGLNDHLIAKIFPVDKDGKAQTKTALAEKNDKVDRDNDFDEVHAPLLDGAEIEASMNWQSPFENSGAESVSPALTQMMQSGELAGLFNAMSGENKDSLIGELGGKISEHEGRSGMTKLNSTQIFTGSMPLRLTCTLVFRAYENAKEEVVKPIEQMWKWVLPQHLQEDGVLAGAVSGQNDGIITTFLPSLVPQMVGITYKGRTFAPMVVESISEPIDSPIDKDGNYTQMLLPITLASLTALDRSDWVKASTKV